MQDRLQHPGGPAGPEHAPRDDPVDDRRGPAEGGDPQVGAVRLREAAHVQHPPRQPAAEAHVGGDADRARVVVFDHDRRSAAVLAPQQPGQLRGALGGHRGAGRVLRARLQQHDGRGESSAAAKASGTIPSSSTSTATGSTPSCVEQVEEGREGGVLDDDPVAEPSRASSRLRSIASSAPLTTVIDSAGNGQVSRSRPSSSGMSGLAGSSASPRVGRPGTARGRGPGAGAGRACRGTGRAGPPAWPSEPSTSCGRQPLAAPADARNCRCGRARRSGRPRRGSARRG